MSSETDYSSAFDAEEGECRFYLLTDEGDAQSKLRELVAAGWRIDHYSRTAGNDCYTMTASRGPLRSGWDANADAKSLMIGDVVRVYGVDRRVVAVMLAEPKVTIYCETEDADE